MIDQANEAIERFMLADQELIEKFVTCDFHLTQSALAWIVENHLLTGERVFELGSGLWVVGCGLWVVATWRRGDVATWRRGDVGGGIGIGVDSN